ncbi:hypothetical protein QQ045_012123 [Rhodiola kirilowii]
MGMMIGFVLVLAAIFGTGVGKTVVETLPGLSGVVPFEMETGYVSVGDMEEVEMFYYFVKSQKDSVNDPLLVWLGGDLGCSGLSSFLYDIGPVKFNVSAFNGSFASIELELNPYSWTKVANILFIDQPVGAGFSFSTSEDAYNTSDTKASKHLYTFLRKWLNVNPDFVNNPLYVGGNSYAGITVPLLVEHILAGLEERLSPQIQLMGYVLGNPQTDYYIDNNMQIPYVYRVDLISDEYYEDAKLYCYEDYLNVEENNTLCLTSLETIKDCLLQINFYHVLEPQCEFSSQKPKELESNVKAHEGRIMESLSTDDKNSVTKCREQSYLLSYKWANSPSVQSALGVLPGTIESWNRCPKNFSTYTEDVTSTISAHKNFSEHTSLRALVYSGDHDIAINHLATEAWIKLLEVTVSDEWRAWYVDGQVAGYQTKYGNDLYRLTYATVKGAGHNAPEYKPEAVFALADRFFSFGPI